MAHIFLNNYDNSYVSTKIQVATWIWYQFTQGQTITDKNNVEWTVNVTEDSSRVIYQLYNYTATHYDLDDFADIADSLHLGDLSEYLNANVVGMYPTSKRFGAGTNNPDQPFIDLMSSDELNCSCGYNFNNTRYGFAQSTGQHNYLMAPLCVYPNEDMTTCRYGYLSVVQEGGGGNTMFVYLGFFKPITDAVWGLPDLDPGKKGFEPTGARTNKNIPGIGGRGTSQKKEPDYAGDTVTQPGAPDESVASAVGAGFLTSYKIDEANLHKVGQNLYGDTLLTAIKQIAVNPIDFIVSLMVFPCSPASIGSASYVKLGGWLCKVPPVPGDPGRDLGTEAVGYPLTSQFKVIDFGTVEIPENWGNFLDYSQTTIELYLPFIGSVNLDVSEAMGGFVNVQYTIDFFTGMCVANVLCSKPMTLPNGKVLGNVNAQHSYQGNCAIQIPLSSTDYGSMIGSLINACTQSITNPVNGFMGIASDAIGGGFRPNVTSKGNIVANSGFCAVLYPYIRLTRPVTAEPDSYQECVGYMSYINTSLGECSDLCVCDSINLSGISGATESELNRIRQMCLDGVYV